MKRKDRLRSPREFQRVLAERRLFAGRTLVAFALSRPAERSEVRVGVTSSRRIKGAIARNRARRRLREVARLVLLRDDSPLRRPGIRFDVILVARPELAQSGFELLRRDAERVLELVRET